MESIDEQPAYYSAREAALALGANLKTLEQIEADKGRYEWSMPYHVEQERDRAVERVRDAIRYLCTEEN